MNTTPAPTFAAAGVRRGGRGALVLRLLPVGMAVMVAVDSVMGDAAEYFHATRLLQAWGSVVRGRGVGEQHFVVGQDRMGDALSLGVGSALFVLEPAIVLAALVYGASAGNHLGRRRRVR